MKRGQDTILCSKTSIEVVSSHVNAVRIQRTWRVQERLFLEKLCHSGKVFNCWTLSLFSFARVSLFACSPVCQTQEVARRRETGDGRRGCPGGASQGRRGLYDTTSGQQGLSGCHSQAGSGAGMQPNRDRRETSTATATATPYCFLWSGCFTRASLQIFPWTNSHLPSLRTAVDQGSQQFASPAKPKHNGNSSKLSNAKKWY